MDTEDNVKIGYICTLCNAHGFEEGFKDKHNSMELTGLDLKTGDVFFDHKPTLNDSEYSVFLIRRESRATTSHERQYLTQRYEVTVGKSIRAPDIVRGADPLPSSYLEGEFTEISDEKFSQFKILLDRYAKDDEKKLVNEVGGLRKGTLKK